jgi:hypothetical protein
MPSTTKSHVKNGHAYFKNTGRYNEVKTSAKDSVNNDSSSSLIQTNLASKGDMSSANAWKEIKKG